MGDGEMGMGGWGDGETRGQGDKGTRSYYFNANYQLPMPNAQCPMPNAQCLITNYQLPNYLNSLLKKLDIKALISIFASG